MLHSRAIEKFMQRPLRDFRAFKKLPDDRLEQLKGELPIAPPIWDNLQRHQKVMFLIGAREQRFAFLADTGVGKSLVAIALAKYFRKQSLIKRVLVLVPNVVNKTEWELEIQKHSPQTSYCILQGPTRSKWQLVRDSDALITIETYAGLIRMVSGKQADHRGKVKLRPDPALLRELQETFQGVVCDESTAVKSKLSLAWRVCRQLSKSAQVVFALTGTPFGRDPIDLWAQMYLVDQGETLGQTLGLFRAAMCREVHNGWAVKWVFEKKNNKALHRMLANRSIRYTVEAADLPRLVQIKKYVTLPQDAAVLYHKARDHLVTHKGNILEQRIAFVRMRQISSGFVGFKDDDTGERAEVEFEDNPKLHQLMSIVESIPPEFKVIVFHDFIHSGNKICRALAEANIGHLYLWGGTKDKDALLKQFNGDVSAQVLVLNNAAGGFGLNLQVAKYGIYFESPVSAIIRKQTRRRFERQHSLHQKVFQYDLITKGTVDEQILQFHSQAKSAFDAIVEGAIAPL